MAAWITLGKPSFRTRTIGFAVGVEMFGVADVSKLWIAPTSRSTCFRSAPRNDITTNSSANLLQSRSKALNFAVQERLTKHLFWFRNVRTGKTFEFKIPQTLSSQMHVKKGCVPLFLRSHVLSASE